MKIILSAVLILFLSSVGGTPDDERVSSFAEVDYNDVNDTSSCMSVDRDTCIARASDNLARAEAMPNKDDGAKRYLLDEFYRIPGKDMEAWKRIMIIFCLGAAHETNEMGEFIPGSQDPKSPLSLAKIFAMLGREDCCNIDDELLEQLYHRRDVVKYIVDTLYNDNPNFYQEMAEKDKQRDQARRGGPKGENNNDDKRSIEEEIVDLYYEGSKPEGGKDMSNVFHIFTRCLLVLSEEPGTTLVLSDVIDMLGETAKYNFSDTLFGRRDVVVFMVSTLMKDLGGPLAFSKRMSTCDGNEPLKMEVINEHDISDVVMALVDQLLDIRNKSFELYRYAIFNVLLSKAPDDTFGTVAYALDCPKWQDSCLRKLAERRDVMALIIFELIKRDEGKPITTKERIKVEFDAILHPETVAVTFDLNVVVRRVFYIVFMFLVVAAALVFQSLTKKGEDTRKKKTTKKKKKMQ